jgi:acyl-CoA hydrolase
VIATVAQTGEWKREYASKLVSADDAVLCIKSGDSVYVHSHAAAPEPLIDAMAQRSDHLRNVKILHILTLGKAAYIKPECADAFKVHALFIGPNVRPAVNEGRADYTPVHLSEIPYLFQSRTIPIDVCMIQVSPPDAHGYCSYGVSVDCTVAARKAARIVIAEVNKQMPRTLGRSFVHVSKLDHIVETDRPLAEFVPAQPGEVEKAIGRHVAELVEDGATLQLGIGAIPNAVLLELRDRRDMGVHSEMLSDGIVDLVECGSITNDRKTILPGKIAVAFVMGTRRLYDFVDNNPLVEFQTVDFINDPFIIAQNYKMTSINSALEVDVTGQVVAGSIGTHLHSGVGGQVDFVRGASRSRGGKAVIALPSTAKDGAVSRIKSFLTTGAAVTTSRADVHYIVTEYGVASLHGASLKERMRSLIRIAHPDFREQLEEECEKVPWLRS